MSFSCLFSFGDEVEWCLSSHGGGTMKKMWHNDLDTSIFSSVVPRSVPPDVVVQIMRVCNLWVAMQAIMLRVMNNKTCKFECCYIKGRDSTYVLLECGLTSAVIRYECVVLCLALYIASLDLFDWPRICWDIVVEEYDALVSFVRTAFHSSCLIAQVWIGAGTTMLYPWNGPADLRQGDVFGIVAKIDQWTVMSFGYEHWYEFWLAIDWLCRPLDGWAMLRWVSHWWNKYKKYLVPKYLQRCNNFMARCWCHLRPFAYLLQRMISFRGAARSECWLTLTKVTSSLACCNWYFVFHVSGADVMNDLQFQAGQQVSRGCRLWHQCIVSRCVDQICEQNSVSVNRALA
jgi:hypothetical protein